MVTSVLHLTMNPPWRMGMKTPASACFITNRSSRACSRSIVILYYPLYLSKKEGAGNGPFCNRVILLKVEDLVEVLIGDVEVDIVRLDTLELEETRQAVLLLGEAGTGVEVPLQFKD